MKRILVYGFFFGCIICNTFLSVAAIDEHSTSIVLKEDYTFNDLPAVIRLQDDVIAGSDINHPSDHYTSIIVIHEMNGQDPVLSSGHVSTSSDDAVCIDEDIEIVPHELINSVKKAAKKKKKLEEKLRKEKSKLIKKSKKRKHSKKKKNETV